MFSRYKRLVPRVHRALIVEHSAQRLDWFVGAAEQPLDRDDPALQKQIQAVEDKIDEHHRQKNERQQEAKDSTRSQSGQTRDQARR